MKIKNIFAAGLFALAALYLSSCKDSENYEYHLNELYEQQMVTDSALNLVNVVNTGLYYNSSELPSFPEMERVGDTLNVFIAVNANEVVDSLTIKYYTQADKLYIVAYPYIDPKLVYAQALCIITRKLQFVGKVDRDYELVRYAY